MDDESRLDIASSRLEQQAMDETANHVVMHTSDNHPMIIDSMEVSNNGQAKSKKKKRKKKKKNRSEDGEVKNDDVKSNGVGNEQCQPGTKASKKLLSNPDQILKSVLEKTTWKHPNLSLAVAQKFNEPDFRRELKYATRTIKYADTIGSSQVRTSVLPTCFDRYRINIDQTAITSLTCIYEKPEKKFNWKEKRKAKKKKKPLICPKKDDKAQSNAKHGRNDGVANNVNRKGMTSTSMMADAEPPL